MNNYFFSPAIFVLKITHRSLETSRGFQGLLNKSVDKDYSEIIKDYY